MTAGRVAAKLRAGLLVAAALVAVAGGQSHRPEHEGREHDHDGHPGGPLGPLGQHGHQDGEMEGFHRPAAVCSAEQTKDAVEASSAYVECSGLEYSDFMSLVHADMQILADAAACFKGKVDEIKPDVAPGENPEKTEEEVERMNAELDKALDACVDEAKKADDTNAAQATTDFLERMLGPDSKVCTCFPAFVDKMPECESWSRFHHFGLRLEELCTHVDGVPMLPGPVEVTEEEEVTATEEETPESKLPPGDDIEVKAVEPESAAGAAEGEQHSPHLPDTWGPCPPGQEPHPEDPTDCQPVGASESGRGPPGGADDRGPPSGGGLFGLGMSVLGVVAIGAAIGFGGVWAWGKFSSGTRQPGVRYMATGLEDDNLGTELGPFGREYA